MAPGFTNSGVERGAVVLGVDDVPLLVSWRLADSDLILVVQQVQVEVEQFGQTIEICWKTYWNILC